MWKQILLRQAQPFVLKGSNFDDQHIDVSCRPKDVIARASDDPINDDVSTKNSEADGDEPEEGPYEVDLNRMLGEDIIQFERAAACQNVNLRLNEEMEEVEPIPLTQTIKYIFHKIVHAIKMFSIKLHKQYFVYKSTESLLKLGWKDNMSVYRDFVLQKKKKKKKQKGGRIVGY